MDANNLWSSAPDCIHHLTSLPGQAFAIEEPLAVGDLRGFRAVGEASSMRVVLDESLLRAEQLEALPDPERWIVNLRVSKMGGILRSIDVAKHAARLGIGTSSAAKWAKPVFSPGPRYRSCTMQAPILLPRKARSAHSSFNAT